MGVDQRMTVSYARVKKFAMQGLQLAWLNFVPAKSPPTEVVHACSMGGRVVTVHIVDP
jgi:hypothetical protein